MSKFEKDIKNKLNSGEVKFNPDHWEQLNKKLDAQNQYTPFEKKIKDIFDNSEATAMTASWDDMNDRLNHSNPSDFNKKVKEIVAAESVPYSGDAWEDMRDQLSNQDLTPFESSIKNKFKNNEATYDPAHWDDMKARLDAKKKRPIAWWIWSGAAAIFIIGAIGISKLDNQKTPFDSVDHSNQSISSINNNVVVPKNTTKIDIANSTSKSEISNNSINNKVYTKSTDKNNIKTPNAPVEIKSPAKNVISENNSKKKYGLINLKNKTGELFLNLEQISKLAAFIKKPKQPQLHAAATLWLNFWDNPSTTGFYGKHQFSNKFNNAFETIKSDKTDFGKIDLIQPIQNHFGYEYNIGKSGFAVGVFHKYLLKKNWNYNDINISASYKKSILPQLNIRLGASATFHQEQLAVNRLTLRERALYGDYIFTSELGDFQAKTENYISYNIGGFIEHPYFFLGYTAENFNQTFTNKTTEEIITKHRLIAGTHITILDKVKASAMLKYEKNLISTYSPAIGITFNNKYFIVGEYNKLNRYDLSIGYNWQQRLRIMGTFGIKQTTDEDYQLNLDHFQEREGYVSVGAYLTIN